MMFLLASRRCAEALGSDADQSSAMTRKSGHQEDRQPSLKNLDLSYILFEISVGIFIITTSHFEVMSERHM